LNELINKYKIIKSKSTKKLNYNILSEDCCWEYILNSKNIYNLYKVSTLCSKFS
jgi:hypothetical protein